MEAKPKRRYLRTVKPLFGSNLIEFEAGVTGNNPHAGSMPCIKDIKRCEGGFNVFFEMRPPKTAAGQAFVPFSNVVEYIEET